MRTQVALLSYSFLCTKLSKFVSGILLKAEVSACQLSLNFYVGFILHVFCIFNHFTQHCELKMNLKTRRWDFTGFPCLLIQSSLHLISTRPTPGWEEPPEHPAGSFCGLSSAPWGTATVPANSVPLPCFQALIATECVQIVRRGHAHQPQPNLLINSR